MTSSKSCDTHKRYQAKRPPRVDCFECWMLYGEKVGLEVFGKAIDRFFGGDKLELFMHINGKRRKVVG